jgi:hypothetical protein
MGCQKKCVGQVSPEPKNKNGWQLMLPARFRQIRPARLAASATVETAAAMKTTAYRGAGIAARIT